MDPVSLLISSSDARKETYASINQDLRREPKQCRVRKFSASQLILSNFRRKKHLKKTKVKILEELSYPESTCSDCE
jgi:hypothetical protein